MTNKDIYTSSEKNTAVPDGLEELKALCKRTGREITYRRGFIVTSDIYEGTDAQYFKTYEEAIEWEKGYFDMVSCEETDIQEEEMYEDEISISL